MTSCVINGLSPLYESQTEALLQLLTAQRPDIKVVLGGPEVSHEVVGAHLSHVLCFGFKPPVCKQKEQEFRGPADTCITCDVRAVYGPSVGWRVP